MKRSPLKRGKPLARGTKPFLDRSPLNRVSAKRKAIAPERCRVVEEVMARSGGRCEIRWNPAVCWDFADQVHEKLTRARSGRKNEALTDVNNCLATCSPCHSAAHHWPDEAVRRGVLLHSWDA